MRWREGLFLSTTAQELRTRVVSSSNPWSFTSRESRSSWRTINTPRYRPRAERGALGKCRETDRARVSVRMQPRLRASAWGLPFLGQWRACAQMLPFRGWSGSPAGRFRWRSCRLSHRPIPRTGTTSDRSRPCILPIAPAWFQPLGHSYKRTYTRTLSRGSPD